MAAPQIAKPREFETRCKETAAGMAPLTQRKSETGGKIHADSNYDERGGATRRR